MGIAETRLTAKVKKALEEWTLVKEVEKVHQSGYSSELGRADICGKFKDNTEFHLELKTEDKKFSGLKFNQAFVLWKKSIDGACVGVVSTMEELKYFMENFNVNHDIIEKRLNKNLTEPEFEVVKNKPKEN